MPRGWIRGPQGQERPVSTSACAVHVMKIATGEIAENVKRPPLQADADTVRNGGPSPLMYGPGLPPPKAEDRADF